MTFTLLYDPAAREALDQAILLGVLVCARLMPIVQLAPFLGGKSVPQTVKMGLGLVLALIVYPAVWLSGAGAELAVGAASGPLVIAILVLKEVLVGLVIGYFVALIFDAATIAGQLIDNASGVTQATSLVPQLPERVSLSANLLFQLAIVVFFISGAHRLFLAALVRSYEQIPPHVFLDPGDTLAEVTLSCARLFADTLTLGVMLAFPVIAAIGLANLFLALVNKSAPQINVFFLGMPIKATLAVVVVLVGLDTFAARFLDESLVYLAELARVLELVSGGAR